MVFGGCFAFICADFVSKLSVCLRLWLCLRLLQPPCRNSLDHFDMGELVMSFFYRRYNASVKQSAPA